MSGLKSSLGRMAWVRGLATPVGTSCHYPSNSINRSYHNLISSTLPIITVPFNGSTGSALLGGGLQRRQRFHRGTQPTCARFKLKLERRGGGAADEVERKSDKSGGKGESEEETESYLKSHPYRAFANVWSSKSELASNLVDNVILNDHGIFVTNKPFGVGVRKPNQKQLQRKVEGAHSLHLRGVLTSPYTLEDILPDLRHLLGKPNLVLVRSAEKLSSGIAVFADDEAIGEKFQKAVSSSKVYYDTLYKYHIISVLPPILLGEPNKTERIGVILKPTAGSDLRQPVLMRNYSKNSVKRQDVIPIHCQTKILQMGTSAGGSGSGYLLELNVSSVASNFLRIHCADKLAPILGDQLYSSRVQTLKGLPVKIDPGHLSPGVGYQKLPNRMLELLQLKKPEDSLIVPTHVHLKSYKVRKFVYGAEKQHELELVAPYPPYFKWTCEQLGIFLEPDPVNYARK